MFMQEITVTELEGTKAGREAAEQTFHMDEHTFRAFYEKTSRPLWSYLSRVSGSGTLADDLMQESYYRFLRAQLKSDDEAYEKNYLFRIATNLMRDHWRRAPRTANLKAAHENAAAVDYGAADRLHKQSDLNRALARLKPRERELLWLAYVEGASHKEIAEVVGLRTGSIRLLLFRARRKMADVLRAQHLSPRSLDSEKEP
jgi:RNA polymerase sigma-70 factor, ECF subfamily